MKLIIINLKLFASITVCLIDMGQLYYATRFLLPKNLNTSIEVTTNVFYIFN